MERKDHILLRAVNVIFGLFKRRVKILTIPRKGVVKVGHLEFIDGSEKIII